MKKSRKRATVKSTLRKAEIGKPEDIETVRKNVVNVIVGESVEMAVRSVRSVKEAGNVTALKYLWEVAGLFPTKEGAQEEEEEPESLAGILMERLGLSGEFPPEEETNKPPDVESEPREK